MSAGRSINGDSPCAYRVVQDFPRTEQQKHYGPYSTLGSAKGKRTTIIGQSYGNPVDPKNVWIEKTPDGWERVDV